MYKALYRKYRPEVFSDVVGQEHITKILQHQVENGNVSHAYLFTGSRGTGKTTCAKILAKAINCENPNNGSPCNECSICKSIANDSLPDVIEMDAASNNGVDYIRELRERIMFAPAAAKKKVYIVDEVHMLSSSASNALLKTLEEPPEHAVFILATTEVNAILPTILSRCQRFDFKRIEPNDIIGRIKYVAEKENFTITDSAAAALAGIADGGMRDALSILDLCAAASNNITEDLVCSVCGKAKNEHLFALASKIMKGDTAAALNIIASLYGESIDMQSLCISMCEFYRTAVLILSGYDPILAVGSTESLADEYKNFCQTLTMESAMNCLNVLNDALAKMNKGNRRSILEMAVVKLTTPHLDSSADALLARIANLEKKLNGIANGTIKVSAQPVPQENIYSVSESQDSARTIIEEQPFENSPNPIFEASNNTASIPQKAVSSIQATAEEPIKSVNPFSESNNSDIESGLCTPLSAWNDIVEETFKYAPLIAGFLRGTTASTMGKRIVIHSQSDQLRGMLEKKEAPNYKGLCKAIVTVLGEEFAPIVEKKKTNSSNDPLLSFEARLNNL